MMDIVKARKLQQEFFTEGTTRERQRVIFRWIRLNAVIDSEHAGVLVSPRCMNCKELIVFLGSMEGPALDKGHVYSLAGVTEVRITSLCEFCFDDITMPLDEDEPEDWIEEL